MTKKSGIACKLAKVSFAVSSFPWLCTVVAEILAYIGGCRVDEGGSTCGGFVYGLFAMGWVGILLIPVFLVGVVCLVACLLSRMKPGWE